MMQYSLLPSDIIVVVRYVAFKVANWSKSLKNLFENDCGFASKLISEPSVDIFLIPKSQIRTICYLGRNQRFMEWSQKLVFHSGTQVGIGNYISVLYTGNYSH